MNVETETLEGTNIDAPIFVVGCGRSGTGLMLKVLGEHPDLTATAGYPDGEDHIGWVKWGKCHISGLGNVKGGLDVVGESRCLHMTENDVTEEIRLSMRRYYSSEVLSGDKSKRVVSKCSHLSNKLAYVKSIFPDAKFIHIVRDCMAVTRSWFAVLKNYGHVAVYWPEVDFPCLWCFPKRAGQLLAPPRLKSDRILPGNGEHLIGYWKTLNMNVYRQLPDNDDIIRVYYEDLVGNPQGAADKIADFCDIKRFKINKGMFLQDTHNRWIHLISSEDEERLKFLAYEPMRHFGYDN